MNRKTMKKVLVTKQAATKEVKVFVFVADTIKYIE